MQLKVTHLVTKFLSAHERKVYGMPIATFRCHVTSILTSALTLHSSMPRLPSMTDPPGMLQTFYIDSSTLCMLNISYISLHLVTFGSPQVTKYFQKSSLFWDVTQPRLVVSYRRFEKTYRSHLQGPSSELSRNVGN